MHRRPESSIHPRWNTSFTLMEMILVVVIIALLAALVLPKVTGWAEKSRIAAAKAQVSSFKTALGSFETEYGRLPTTAEGLRALVERPAGWTETVEWKRSLDESYVPQDPWGRDYLYRNPGTVNTDGYDLYSLGPDGQDGTDDDVGNTRR